MKVLMSIAAVLALAVSFSVASADDADAWCGVGFRCGGAVLVPAPHPIPLRRSGPRWWRRRRADPRAAGLLSRLRRAARLADGSPWRLCRASLRAASLRGRRPTVIGRRTTTPTMRSPPMRGIAVSAPATPIGAGTAGTIRSAGASATSLSSFRRELVDSRDRGGRGYGVFPLALVLRPMSPRS